MFPRRHKLRRIALTLTLLMTLPRAAFASQDGPASDIQLTVLDKCAASGSTKLASLIVSDEVSGARIPPSVIGRLAQDENGVTSTLHLHPGFYNITASFGGEVGDCDGSLLLPVLVHRNQSAMLIARKSVLLRSSYAMLAGILPFSGYLASIVYYPQDQDGKEGLSSFVEIPARVIDDAYYVTGLPNGVARLRVYAGDRTSYVEFKLGRIGGSQRYRVFNVSSADVTKALAALKY